MKIPVDTHTFHYYNANLKNKHTTDCVIRALSLALNQSYEHTLSELVDLWLKTGYDLCDVKCYGKYLELKGWTKMKQPKTLANTKYTGSQFCLLLNHDSSLSQNTPVLAHIGSQHIACIKQVHEDGEVLYKIHDTWNCSAHCVGVYWVKL